MWNCKLHNCKQKHLESAWTPHGFLCYFLKCGKNCYILCRCIFQREDPSQHIPAVVLDHLMWHLQKETSNYFQTNKTKWITNWFPQMQCFLYISTDYDGIKEQLRSKHTFILGFHIFRHDISMFLRSMSVELHTGVKSRRAMITGVHKRCGEVFTFHVISCVAFPLVGEIGANFARIFASEGIPRYIFHQLLRICQCVT